MFSVFRRTSEVPLYRIEKNPKLARRQGAYSVISATGQIVRRGHELDRVLRAIDKSSGAGGRLIQLGIGSMIAPNTGVPFLGSCSSGGLAALAARAPAASARVSSQRPNLKPTSGSRADLT